MKARRPSSKIGRVYEALLLLYPAEHRRTYGVLMLQLFRDQLRDAERGEGPLRRTRLCCRTLLDLVLSTAAEHLTSQRKHMKTIKPSKQSLLLFAAALGSAVLSIALGEQGFPKPAIGFVYLSTCALLARAYVEWLRPPEEAWKGIGWAIGVAIAYGFIFPAWAKLRATYGAALPIAVPLQTLALLLNVLVPVTKSLLGFRQKHS